MGFHAPSGSKLALGQHRPRLPPCVYTQNELQPGVARQNPAHWLTGLVVKPF